MVGVLSPHIFDETAVASQYANAPPIITVTPMTEAMASLSKNGRPDVTTEYANPMAAGDQSANDSRLD